MYTEERKRKREKYQGDARSKYKDKKFENEN